VSKLILNYDAFELIEIIVVTFILVHWFNISYPIIITIVDNLKEMVIINCTFKLFTTFTFGTKVPFTILKVPLKYF